MDDATPRQVVEELSRRIEAGQTTAIDDLVAEDMVNHAAGPQGRDGLKQIMAVIASDLGDSIVIDHHHLVAEGDLVAQHMTMRGRHVGSTMPLLRGSPATHVDVAWTFMHLWRVVHGQIVEHWACRDDVGLLAQIGAWPPASDPAATSRAGVQEAGGGRRPFAP
jgi:predicted ester cyclase